MTATPTNGVTRGANKRKPLMLAPDAIPAPPKPPKHLKASGRAWWSAVWSGGARWLDPASDHLIVELVCNAADQATEIEADISKHGRYYTSPQGYELARPAIADLKALRASQVSWLSMLAFSPSARSEIGAHVQAPNALSLFRDRNSRLTSGEKAK